MTCRSGVVSVAIVVRTARTTASVLTPEPISLRARTQRSGRVLYACVRPGVPQCAPCIPVLSAFQALADAHPCVRVSVSRQLRVLARRKGAPVRAGRPEDIVIEQSARG